MLEIDVRYFPAVWGPGKTATCRNGASDVVVLEEIGQASNLGLGSRAHHVRRGGWPTCRVEREIVWFSHRDLKLYFQRCAKGK